MRFLIIILLIPFALLAKQDTIRVSQLDETIFFKPQIQEFLFDSHVRPINFFYSNTFRYRHRSFTGIAFEVHDKRTFTIELLNGRIASLTEYSGVYNKVVYVFRRLDLDSVLAVDTLFKSRLGGIPSSTQILFKSNGQLRVTSNSERYTSNGVYTKCSIGDKCTDDGWSIFEIRDGLYVSRYDPSYGWSTIMYKEGKSVGPAIGYYPDSTLRAIYNINEHEESEGPFLEYWPNGKLMREGAWINDERIGRWNEYDSTGRLRISHWYSFSLGEEDGSHIDSTMIYHLNGQPKLFSSEIWFYSTCVNEENNKVYTDREYSQRYTTISYYENGSFEKKQVNTQLSCYPNSGDNDTTLWEWFPDGQLKRIVYDGYSRTTEYYPNGRLKQVRNTGSYRDGDVLIYDSTGKLLIDRTYYGGALREVRDVNTGIDSARFLLALKLKGCAAAATFPTPYVEVGGNRYLKYFRTHLPQWNDSIYIPDDVVDSLAYSLAGVYLDAKDSLPLADSLIRFSQEFSPLINEWHYTVQIMQSHRARWVDSCMAGILVTGNVAFDAYLRLIDYEVISFSNGMLTNKLGEIETITIIKTQRPLNYIALHKMLYGVDGNSAKLYCGIGTEPREIYFQVYRPCYGRPDRNCIDLSYNRVNIVAQHPVWKHLFFVRFNYIVNSDQTADCPEWQPQQAEELLEFQSR